MESHTITLNVYIEYLYVDIIKYLCAYMFCGILCDVIVVHVEKLRCFIVIPKYHHNT